jgi:type I restriction enzyme S subunit
MPYPTKKLWEIVDILDNQRKPISSIEREKRIKWKDILYPYYWATQQNWVIDDYLFDEELVLLWEDWVDFYNKYKHKAYLISWKTWVNNHAHVLRWKDWILLNKFLLNFLNIFDYHGYVSWATRLKLNQSSMKNIQIPLPPLPTQKLIVQKLDSSFEKIDKSIELTKKNLKNIEELNKSVLEEVFKNSNFNEKNIDEIAEVKSWKRLPKWEKVLDNKTEFPYIRVSDFDNNWTIDFSNIKYITVDVFNQISRYIITVNDLYISIAWTIWKTWIIPIELNWASLTENAVRLVYKNKNDIFNKYVYYFTTSQYFKEQAWLATRAVAMPKLAITRLKQIKLPLSPLEKQKEIVAQLDQVFEKNKALKDSYEKKLKDLEEMKQSLLKEAFEWRLVKE